MQTPETVRVGVAHGSIKSQLPEGSRVHNEIAADRAERARLDYLALGTGMARARSGAGLVRRYARAGSLQRQPPGNVLLVTILGRASSRRLRHRHWSLQMARSHRRATQRL